LGAALYLGLSVDGEQGERILPSIETRRVTEVVVERLEPIGAADAIRLGTGRLSAALLKWLPETIVRQRVQILAESDEFFLQLVRSLRALPSLGGVAVDWDAAERLFDRDYLSSRAAAIRVTASAADAALLDVLAQGRPRSQRAKSAPASWKDLLAAWDT